MADGDICSSDEVEEQQNTGVEEVVVPLAAVGEDSGYPVTGTRRTTAGPEVMIEDPN